MKKTNPSKMATRDPDRTRGKILSAALQEFSARGYDGARVDKVAQRSGVNKRMIYHYFTDKVGLFRAVLHFKLQQRMARFKSYAETDLATSIANLFKQNCEDIGWVRLLAWESLQSSKNRVLEEKDRRQRAAYANNLISKQQKSGLLRRSMRPEHFHLAMASLALFPFAMPQLCRLITGRPSDDKKFQKDYHKFLETLAAAFRP